MPRAAVVRISGERTAGEVTDKLRLHMPLVKRYKLIEDLVAIVLADGKIADEEVNALQYCAGMLAVAPGFVMDALARPQKAMD